jgi:hypothetical protein
MVGKARKAEGKWMARKKWGWARNRFQFISLKSAIKAHGSNMRYLMNECM